ncbi:hypothetical protein [Parasitella parasitica]|uniref:C2H2-type domain-containing protein n=1 Tax=Parasitella parasitica TaxID=35722 RepID=A0A0B7NR93_9FUNG|nr:hypothetical protein [Parasitella parasitica]
MKLRSLHGRVVVKIKTEAPLKDNAVDMKVDSNIWDRSKDQLLLNTSASRVKNEGGVCKEYKSGDGKQMMDSNKKENVKVEDVLKNETLLNQEPDRLRITYTYKCNKCDEPMPSLKSVVDHRWTVHKARSNTKAMKHMELEPDVYDANRYCRTCEFNFGNLSRYLFHLKKIHFMDLRKNMEPEPDDPNFYCRACESKYANRCRYRNHLLIVHKMRWEDTKRRDIVPDWNDPQFYCAPCGKSFPAKEAFHKHCRCAHKLKYRDIVRPGNPDWDDPNFYCKICNNTFQDKVKYMRHCRGVHRMKCKKSFPNPDAKPDISDVHNHCNICDKRFATRLTYHKHLFLFHNILTKPRITNQVIPFVDEQKAYSCACDKTLSSKIGYREDLETVHSIKMPFKRNKEDLKPVTDGPNIHCDVCQRDYSEMEDYMSHLHQTRKMENADIFPDPNDPNLYCRVCNKTYGAESSYRNHCKTIHWMQLAPLVRGNPDALIDVNSPDFFCAKCLRHYKTKKYYRSHLSYAHNTGP